MADLKCPFFIQLLVFLLWEPRMYEKIETKGALIWKVSSPPIFWVSSCESWGCKRRQKWKLTELKCQFSICLLVFLVGDSRKYKAMETRSGRVEMSVLALYLGFSWFESLWSIRRQRWEVAVLHSCFGFPHARAKEVQDYGDEKWLSWKVSFSYILWFSSCKSRGIKRRRWGMAEFRSWSSVCLFIFLVWEPGK